MNILPLEKAQWLTTGVILLSLSIHTISGNRSPPDIAVVGAGIGGSASAHFLRQEFGDDAKIDVYESKEVGGRMASVAVDGRHYEAGGSVIHPNNWYMVNFTKLLGLRKRDPVTDRLGIYDGHQMVLDGFSWTPLFVAQLLWKYGLSAYKLSGLVQSVLADFDNIYIHQREGKAFTTVEKLLLSMSTEMSGVMDRSIKEELQKRGFGERFIEEVVLAIMRNNYGQDCDMQAFVGLVSLAGAEPGLWSVHGGNKLVPEGLLRRSKAKLHMTKVTGIKLKSTDSAKPEYEVTTEAGKSRVYDLVIIATPLHSQTRTSFDHLAEHFDVPDVHFQRTVATFVRGLPNAAKFGYRSTYQLPDVLFTCNTGLFFNSIGKQSHVHINTKHWEESHITPVWKVFSREPLTPEQIDDLFVSAEDVTHVDWLAYPQYASGIKNAPPFELHPGIYYVGAIEAAASAIEMSAIGARNVALLAHHRWTKQEDLVDPNIEQNQRSKSEL